MLLHLITLFVLLKHYHELVVLAQPLYHTEVGSSPLVFIFASDREMRLRQPGH